MLSLGLPITAHADTKSDGAFDALRKQGIEKQQRGDLDGALESLEAAARLKNAPNIWLNIVSVHADRAKAKKEGIAFCTETESALASFFDAWSMCLCQGVGL